MSALNFNSIMVRLKAKPDTVFYIDKKGISIP